MKRIQVFFLFLFFPLLLLAQPTQQHLTVEKIMQDQKWIGTSPSQPQWSSDGKTLYFLWNPEKADADSFYRITLTDKTPKKLTPSAKLETQPLFNAVYNEKRTACLYTKSGDIHYLELGSGKTRRVMQSSEVESNPVFSFRDSKVVYTRSQNLFAWDILTGETEQLTAFQSGMAGNPPGTQRGTGQTAAGNMSGKQEEWLKKDQLRYMKVLKERKDKRDAAEAYEKSLPKAKSPKIIPLDDKTVSGITISPDGRYVTYRLNKPGSGKTTIVPNYVTESGFTTDIPSRTKVGAPQTMSECYVYDREKDTVVQVKTDSLAGIRDLPAYLADYRQSNDEKPANNPARQVSFTGPFWSPNGTYAAFDLRAQDNKDRWLVLLDPATGNLRSVDRQHDDAWIGGPGIGFGRIGWVDEETLWFHSEKTGYSHLYLVNVRTGLLRALTSGTYEVQQAQVSNDKKSFYITTNEVHPGEQQFYRLYIADGKKEKLTSLTGANLVSLAPDEKHLAILYSYISKPWELYLMENKAGARPEQITFSAKSSAFQACPWQEPEVISFTAADGAKVYARLYKPVTPKAGSPAVLFVHGAGYLQNAHKWWSSYFREYMFNNLLAEKGYVVMDIDYRGSAGYGRDWRTGIYRHMGGKDLSDHVDAVRYLVKNHGVDPQKIGIYGGSYGGFITLMALFTQPDVFQAGAALRPVTDWAQYNHGYTSNILNEPFADSIAYRRSSPLYFAEGLKGHLLICHGMVDVNVHYQDAVKLAQRLIELEKDNWEFAAYPMEDHGFIEPSSWTDEYKRIYKLFEKTLKKAE
jgi:dipeptidyl aminopeptidase/acylaminoacyl peptidase